MTQHISRCFVPSSWHSWNVVYHEVCFWAGVGMCLRCCQWLVPYEPPSLFSGWMAFFLWHSSHYDHCDISSLYMIFFGPFTELEATEASWIQWRLRELCTGRTHSIHTANKLLFLCWMQHCIQYTSSISENDVKIYKWMKLKLCQHSDTPDSIVWKPRSLLYSLAYQAVQFYRIQVFNCP